MIGKTLGKYHILEEIGHGGMGAVYRGYDTVLQRQVAVKVLAPHLAREKDFVERFLREARTAARLKHPNIVTIHDVGEQEDNYYIVMELLEGETLAQIVARRSPLPLVEVVSIASQVASALDHAHGRGLVHRDIKPSNVIVDKEGHATLTDFGIVRAVEGTRITSTGAILGTPDYMSPEQGRGNAVDARSDIYSLGAMLFEMLTGRVPYKAETPMAVVIKHITDPVPRPTEFNPAIPKPMERVVLKALAKDPADRFQSAGQMVEALQKAVAEAPVPAKVAPPPPPVETPIETVPLPEPEIVPPPLVEPVAVPQEEVVPFWQKMPLWGRSAIWVGLVVILIAAAIYFERGLIGALLAPPTATPNRALTATAWAQGTATARAQLTARAQATATGLKLVAVVQAEALNVRGGPGTEYDVVEQVKQGDDLEVLARTKEGDWLQVRLTNGKEGWVSTQWMEVRGEVTGIPVATLIPPTPPPTAPPGMVYVPAGEFVMGSTDAEV